MYTETNRACPSISHSFTLCLPLEQVEQKTCYFKAKKKPISRLKLHTQIFPALWPQFSNWFQDKMTGSQIFLLKLGQCLFVCFTNWKKIPLHMNDRSIYFKRIIWIFNTVRSFYGSATYTYIPVYLLKVIFADFKERDSRAEFSQMQERIHIWVWLFTHFWWVWLFTHFWWSIERTKENIFKTSD